MSRYTVPSKRAQDHYHSVIAARDGHPIRYGTADPPDRFADLRAPVARAEAVRATQPPRLPGPVRLPGTSEDPILAELGPRRRDAFSLAEVGAAMRVVDLRAQLRSREGR